jgi:hypothetical protein
VLACLRQQERLLVGQPDIAAAAVLTLLPGMFPARVLQTLRHLSALHHLLPPLLLRLSTAWDLLPCQPAAAHAASAGSLPGHVLQAYHNELLLDPYPYVQAQLAVHQLVAPAGLDHSQPDIGAWPRASAQHPAVYGCRALTETRAVSLYGCHVLCCLAGPLAVAAPGPLLHLFSP